MKIERTYLKLLVTVLVLFLSVLSSFSEEYKDTTVYKVGNRNLIEIQYGDSIGSKSLEFWRYYVKEQADSVAKLQKIMPQLPVMMLPYNDDKRLMLSAKRFSKMLIEYLTERNVLEKMVTKYSYGHFSVLIFNNGSIIPRWFDSYTSIARVYSPDIVIDILERVMQCKFLAPVVSVLHEDGYIIRSVPLGCETE